MLFAPFFPASSLSLSGARKIAHSGAAVRTLFLKQYAVFRFDRFEIGLLAKHDPHLDFDTPRNKRDRNIIRSPFKRI
jgi:hypothetical protein